MNEELMTHLFVLCSFSKTIWIEITKILGVKEKWDKRTLEENMMDWVTNKVVYTYNALPFLFSP
jgi:hypothetical protein